MVAATDKRMLPVFIDQVGFDAMETGSRSDTSKFIPSTRRIPVKYTYQVVNTYPHDTGAYTQGLIYEDGYLFESTGQIGQSSLRKVKLSTGEVVKAINLPDSVFGEGIASVKNKLIQLSWKSKIAFVVDKVSFRQVCTLPYTIDEGWGLTSDGIRLIMSDGSANLYFLDPVSLTLLNTLKIFNDQGPVDQLNELEFVDNEIWANIFTKDIIVRINPESGEITGEIDLSGLLKPGDRNVHIDVLNGIAWDPVFRRIFITGKNWPKVFEITLRQKQ
jgi:glutaminyl-peptide cyclotransferase